MPRDSTLYLTIEGRRLVVECLGLTDQWHVVDNGCLDHNGEFYSDGMLLSRLLRDNKPVRLPSNQD